MRKIRSKNGFTLIELMIVVVIIGILAALAIPRFMRATTKSKQSEAKNTLKQICDYQKIYYRDKGEYWCTDDTASANNQFAFGSIEVVLKPTARYKYIIKCDQWGFTATAYLNDGSTKETWTINEHGTLTRDDTVN